MLSLCTLFNTYYLDKGLALYESLTAVTNDFVLYVLAMDDLCYEVLKEENREFLVPIQLSDFENEDLLRVKSTRSFGEYCWTCSSSLIKYIFNIYNPEYCAYVDADIYFYSDPSCIIEEMKEHNASVQLTGHRFNKFEAEIQRGLVGKFCVEYNTFKNDRQGNLLLDLWILQCLDSCSNYDNIHYGDQKYLNNWVNDYYFVIETQNLGMGIAPWNISQYKSIGTDLSMGIKHKESNNIIKVVFYHFESITYLNESTANINAYRYWGIDSNLVDIFYNNYLKHTHKIKFLLKNKYDISYIMKSNPGHTTIKKKTIKEILKNMYKLLSVKNLRMYILTIIPQRLFRDKCIKRF